jgi:hypothetical protein
MSYREENGQVVLTMSKEDYDRLLTIFAGATAYSHFRNESLDEILELLNRLNQGHPQYTPYKV